MASRISQSPRACAVIVAGGTGERFGSAAGKQLARAGTRSVLAHTISAFGRAATITRIVVVCHPDRVDEYREEATRAEVSQATLIFVPGGETRADSVVSGLDAIPSEFDVVVVHDGARPLVTATLVDEAANRLCTDDDVDGIVVGHPMYDTLKEIEGTRVVATADRSKFWIAQTPQVFSVATLRAAYDRARKVGWAGTDDASYVEAAGGCVQMMEGPRSNIKVTCAEDIDIVEAILTCREREVRP